MKRSNLIMGGVACLLLLTLAFIIGTREVRAAATSDIEIVWLDDYGDMVGDKVIPCVGGITFEGVTTNHRISHSEPCDAGSSNTVCISEGTAVACSSTLFYEVCFSLWGSLCGTP